MTSCGSSKTTFSQANSDALDALVQKKHFKTESDWAHPQATAALQQVVNSGLLGPGSSAGAISLAGNYNHLTISGDSISSHLPYFGERQMNVDYGGGDSAIEFDGVMKNYKAEKNKDHSYTISFEAKSKSENFNVSIKLFPSLKSDMMVSGSSRFSIRYSGSVQELAE